MTPAVPRDAKSEAVRKAVFAALIELQDQRVPVAESRRRVADLFGVPDQFVAQVEREGLENEWPPL